MVWVFNRSEGFDENNVNIGKLEIGAMETVLWPPSHWILGHQNREVIKILRDTLANLV